MRNLKKFLALVLAMLMVVSAGATVSAFDDVAEDNQYAEAIDALVGMGVITGKTADTFAPEESVTRWQMALMMARALNPDEPATTWSNGLKIFTDVEGAHQYPGSIAWAYTEGIVTGIGGGLFAPNNGIKYQDALIMAVRALGYEVDVTGTPYWVDAYAKATKLGLTANITGVEGEDALTRAETAQILYNMIYAETADGESYAALLYGEATATNVTPFIVVGTTKQYAAEGLNIVDGGYVALQEVINGIPAGQIIEVPVEDLGVAAEDIESVFCNFYNLVNFNAKTEAYDDIVLAGTYDVIDNNDVTIDSGKTKLTIDGKIYYAEKAKTGSAVKNEIVIFNTTEGGVAQSQLYTTADGDIIYGGKIVATAVYSLSGEIIAYAPTENAGENIDKAKYYTEAEAKAEWGYTIADSAALFDTMTVADLVNAPAYQLVIYNDITTADDVAYDRAYYTPIYMSVYNTNYKATDDVKIESDAFATTLEDVVINGEVGKGDVFAYTYNKQLNQIDVIGVANELTGSLDKVNTAKIGDSKVVFTIDGVDYTLGNEKLEKAMGANLKETATAPADYADIAKNNRIAYSYAKWQDLAKTADALIKFYEYNGYIIYAETYSIEESFDLAIFDDLSDWDDEVLYLDLYIDGELVEDVPVSKIAEDKDTSYTIANLNTIKLSKLLAKDDLFAKGNIVRIVELADGTYQLSEPLTEATLADYDLYKNGATSGIVIFDDGIADTFKKKDGTIAEAKSEHVLRTTDSTLFYFLEVDEKGDVKSIKVVEGAEDKATLNLANVTVYADAIGYTGDAKGKASEVFVLYTDSADITGFGITSIVDTYVIYVGSAAYTKYTMDLGSDLGIDGDYADKYLLQYSTDVKAVNMSTGAAISKLVAPASAPITAAGFYKVSTDGVIVGTASVETATIIGKALSNDDFDIDATLDLDRRYVSLKDVDGNVIISSVDDDVTKVVFVSKDGKTIKNDASLFTAGADDAEIKYLANEVDDGVFVAIVTNAGTAPDADDGKGDGNETVSGTENVTFVAASGTEYVVQIADITGATLKDVTVTLYNNNEVHKVTSDYDSATVTLVHAIDGAVKNPVEGKTELEAVVDVNEAGQIVFSVGYEDLVGDFNAVQLNSGEKYKLTLNLTAGTKTSTLTWTFVA